MLGQLTIYLPNQLAGVTSDTLQNYSALTTLLRNANVLQPDANEIEIFLASLAISKALVKEQGLSLAQPCLLAQPVNIHLDQTRGYLQLISTTQLQPEILPALDAYLQQHWAEQILQMQFMPEKNAWLIWPKQPLMPASLFRPQASYGMAVNAFVPKASNNSVGVWFNESQMLLHQFNQTYQSPINALWFWGNGVVEQIEYDCIITEDIFMTSFAKANAIACYPSLTSDLLTQYQHILYLADKQNLVLLEQEVFAPALRALKRKILSQVKLAAFPSYQFICNATTFKKWWQSKPSLEHILNDHR